MDTFQTRIFLSAGFEPVRDRGDASNYWDNRARGQTAFEHASHAPMEWASVRRVAVGGTGVREGAGGAGEPLVGASTFQRVAVGTIFHLPARGMELATQPIRFRPLLGRASRTARCSQRLDGVRNRFLARLPLRESQPE